jgi:hypothetical protein
MHETLRVPWVARGTEHYKPTFMPKLGSWKEKRSRRVFVSESHMDLEPHPWGGERQVQRRMGPLNGDLYSRNAYQVDKELMQVPYDQLLTMPRGSTYPVVQGIEFGVGPFPWDSATPIRFFNTGPNHRTRAPIRTDPPRRPSGAPTGDVLAANTAETVHGPGTDTHVTQFRAVSTPPPRGAPVPSGRITRGGILSPPPTPARRR